jgi:hypothetical protein
VRQQKKWRRVGAKFWEYRKRKGDNPFSENQVKNKTACGSMADRLLWEQDYGSSILSTRTNNNTDSGWTRACAS